MKSVYDAWIATRVDITAKTRRGYEDCWRLRVEPAFGSWPLAKVTTAHIQQWVNEMSKKGLSPRTVRWYALVLRMVLDHAVQYGRIAKNPVVGVRYPAKQRPKHIFLKPKEVEELSRLCGPQGDLVLVLALTGLRWGEMTALDVADVDAEARRLRVRRSMSRVGGKLATSDGKSRAAGRSIPYPKLLAPIIEKRIGERSPEHPAIASPKGSRLSLENWMRATQFKEQAKTIGYPALRVHDLRHTAASLAVSAGANVKAVQRMLGHASAAMTLDTYAGLFEADMDAVADKLDDLMERPIRPGEELGPLLAPSEGQLTIEDELIRIENDA